jgi:MtN3 and saliva related transmembrane protein
MLVTVIGTVAGTLTTAAYLPQVVKVWRSRSAGDISLQMYILMVTGASLWVVYGAMLMDWPVIAANAVSALFTATILVFKLRYG